MRTPCEPPVRQRLSDNDDHQKQRPDNSHRVQGWPRTWRGSLTTVKTMRRMRQEKLTGQERRAPLVSMRLADDLRLGSFQSAGQAPKDFSFSQN